MERIKLNLIPSGVAPIVHLSQYDDGRKFGIDLFEGESVYVLDGTETLTVNSRKPDGHVVVLTVTNTGTSSLDVDTVEQLTAVHGVSYAKLQIVKGSVTIATLPFLIDVSRDPLENGDPSESFIQNLRTQIAEGVAEEVATQYDSENVIFDNVPTDNHGIGYTVTSEGIKTAIDNAFDYDNTASGSLVHITDGADNVPVKSFKCAIGSDGFSQADITVCGKNRLPTVLADIKANNTSGTWNNNAYTSNGVTFTLTIDANGNITDITVNGTATQNIYFYIARNLQNVIPSDNSMKLGGCTNGSASTYAIQLYYDSSSSNFINCFNGFVGINSTSKTRDILIVVRSGYVASNLKFYPMVYATSETDTSFVPYIGKTYIVEFGQTFNDGMLVYENGAWYVDVSGVITPITSSTIIKTVSGENYIYSNCGDVEVNYYTSKSNDILEFINTEIGKKNGTNIPIEENSQDSIKDYVDDEISTINTSVSNKASKTEDATITLASGYSLISSSCGKTDRLVHLNFNVEKSGGFATGWQVIGTTEFKPNTLAYCPLWNVTNGVGNGEVRIDTDGTINFYVVTAGEVRLNANIGYVTS